MPRRYLQYFDYERDEVDGVLERFQDPHGLVTYRREALFRRCGCIDPDTGQRKVCVPPQQGFMCRRQALLLKAELTLERVKVDEEETKKDEAKIAEAVKRAKERAEKFVRTEEGE